jgi:2-dehydropantoate 2-reductase
VTDCRNAARNRGGGRPKLGKHIVIAGAGAVGGYVGGHLARAGEDVALIDPWPAHVNAMREQGLRLTGTQGEHVVRVNAMHLTEVQGLARKPIDIAIVCTKSFDTEWATAMIGQYLAPGGYVVSMQNSINEERIASVVGWDRTLGCIASTISVNLVEPGHIMRFQEPGGGKRTVFYVGGSYSERCGQRKGDDQPLGRALDQARDQRHHPRPAGRDRAR